MNMSNGQPNQGGGAPLGDENSQANSSGFGGATMGGPGYALQRPQFGQQPGTPQADYSQGGNFNNAGNTNTMMMMQPPGQPELQNPPGTPQQGYSQASFNGNNGAVASAGYPQTPQSQGSGGHPAGTGSVSRFANSPQMQQQGGPGTPLNPESSPYNFQPPPRPSAGANTAGMSFAQRGAMLQTQQPQGYGQAPHQQPSLPNYGGQPQQQAGRPQMPPQQPPVDMSGMSFAQRSAMIRQNQPVASNVYGGGAQRQQPQTMQYGAPQPAARHPTNAYPPQQQQQQQQQIPQYAQQSMQGSMMSQGSVNSYQPQQQQPVYGAAQPAMGMANQQPGVPGGSFAQRSAMMGQPQGSMPPQQQQPQPPQYGGMPTQQPPQQQQMTMHQQPGMSPQMQQTGMQPSMLPQQPPVPSIYVDPPEVIAQQNRLLTDATRKVQEHAYYMKQAMERRDLPTVLDRAAQMVGELGEHAHSHHHHHVHPPAPGASGTTTALSPKNYYELHLRALEELPTLEDYLLGLAQGGAQTNMPGMMTPGSYMDPSQNMNGSSAYTMKEIYDFVQYCPNVLSRLYLQICAASALIRSGEIGTRWVLKDIIEAVKCIQNPVRGLFLRHYLLQALRDKLPNEPIPPTEVVPYGMAAPSSTSETQETPAPSVVAEVNNMEKGTVKDSLDFVLANFVQMNKLWVRIKHLPGDGKSKEIRRRREKDRNELRILVGTNLVRLSALDSVTSQIYGQIILPTVLDHIIISEDPLAQAYLIDCIVQVFPDEYHIETMPILLAACPKLRDKVNIRTILNSLMERLANYLADEELLDEVDSNQVKRQMAQDSFRMMDECVQSVYNARGPKLQAKEVVRLQTALLTFSMKCYAGNLEQITLCLDNCVVALQQARANQALMQEARNQHMDPNAPRVLPQLEEIATKELEKMLSIPLEELALGVLRLDHYAGLIGFLPWANRRQVARTMLEAVSKAGKSPTSLKEIEELFSVVTPVLRDEFEGAQNQGRPHAQSMQHTADRMAGLGVSYQPNLQQTHNVASTENPQDRKNAALVSKLIHLLHHQDTNTHFAMLEVACRHLKSGKAQRTGPVFTALVFAGLKLAKRILLGAEADDIVSSSDNPTAEFPEQGEETKHDEEIQSGEPPAEEKEVETLGESDTNASGAVPAACKAVT